MKLDKEQNQKTLKIEKKKRPESCEYCIRCIVIVSLFKVTCMPVTVSSYNHFTFCD